MLQRPILSSATRDIHNMVDVSEVRKMWRKKSSLTEKIKKERCVTSVSVSKDTKIVSQCLII